MARESVTIYVNEKGARVASRNIDRIGKSAKTTGGSLQLLKSALGGLAAIGIATGIGLAVKQLASFSQGMSTVAAITQATAGDLAALREEARNLGTTTRFSATQAAEGMTFLARAGFDAQQVLAAIGPTLDLAQAGALSLGRAADIASNILTGFRIDVSDAARVMDVLALAANSANTDVSQLGDAMKFIAPISAGLGVSLEETTAAIQALSDAGIQATMAGTGLRMVMRLLESPMGRQKKILADLGVTADEVRISEVGLTGALLRLSEAGITTGQSLDMFGRAGTAFDVMVNAVPKIERFTAANDEAGGTARRIATIMDDNLNGALLAVKSAAEGLVLSLGELGAQSGLTKFFSGLAKALRATAENMQELLIALKAVSVLLIATFSQQILGKAILMLGGLTKAVASLSVSMTALSGTTAPAAVASLRGLGTAFKALWLTISLNPLVALAIVITGTVLIAFSKLKKMMAEADAQIAKSYAPALAMIRIRLAEVRAIKEGNEAVQQILENLDRENEALKKTAEEREFNTVLFKAETAARRLLTEEEQKGIRNRLKERDAIEAHNDAMQARLDLLNEIKEPQQTFDTNMVNLNALLAQGDINQTEYNKKLLEFQNILGDTSASYESYLTGLRESNMLLSLNNEEQELQRALIAARNALGHELDDGQKKDIENLIRNKQVLKESNEQLSIRESILHRIRGPQEEYVTALSHLNLLLLDGTISLSEYLKEFGKLNTEMTKIVEDETVSALQDVMKAPFDQATDALVEFTKTGKFEIRGFVADILSQWARLAAMKSIAGLGGLLNFATGGAFTVAGAGGVDSQTVAFRATPGERVTVQTPGQQRAQGVPGAAVASVAAPQVNVKVVNLVDPNEFTSVLVSSEGEVVILNVLSRNRTTVRQVVS